MVPTKDELLTLPVFAPLFAAVVAPMSTLLDIPALTEPWFSQREPSGQHTLPDSRTNIVLSAVGLGFNVLANALLIVRFSMRDGHWKYATRASLLCWIVKFGIALGNVIAFGILSRNTPGISYGEGFWCAVMSLLLVSGIVTLLVFHYMLHVRGKIRYASSESLITLRIAGRHFMLQNTLFVLTIGLLALVMSKVEHWTYLQGIYFSVVTFLTVGFGDFYPTKTSTQIVLFPFALVGIVQLASLIDILVRFFRGRLASRHAERRRDFEKRRQEEENELENEPNLEQELQFLRGLYNETDKWRTIQDLVVNVSWFLLFWLLGALIFSQIENWTYGQGLYFCYVFFLTIGYGDYAPVTSAGRVVFIVYSIVAVPVMASFAVQTIQSIFQKFSTNMLRRREAKAGVGIGAAEKRALGESNKIASANEEEKGLPRDARDRLRNNNDFRKYSKSHAEFVAAERGRIVSRLSEFDARQSGREDVGKDAEEGAEKLERDRDREEDRILTEYVLELAVELEKHARRLLLAHMEEGSNARMLLKADRVVQLRNIRVIATQEQSDLGGSKQEDGSASAQSSTLVPRESSRRGIVKTMMQKYYEEEMELVQFPTDLDDQETLEEVAHYREAFAGLLAVGSRLLRLQDEEKFLFERRFWKGRDEVC